MTLPLAQMDAIDWTSGWQDGRSGVKCSFPLVFLSSLFHNQFSSMCITLYYSVIVPLRVGEMAAVVKLVYSLTRPLIYICIFLSAFCYIRCLVHHLVLAIDFIEGFELNIRKVKHEIETSNHILALHSQNSNNQSRLMALWSRDYSLPKILAQYDWIPHTKSPLPGVVSMTLTLTKCCPYGTGGWMGALYVVFPPPPFLPNYYFFILEFFLSILVFFIFQFQIIPLSLELTTLSRWPPMVNVVYSRTDLFRHV